MVNPQAKEATDVEVQDQNNVDLLLRHEFVPEGTTVNQTFHVEVLKRLIGAMRRKRGELWRDCSLILHHDNVPAHSSLRVSQLLARKGISAMEDPPYSPDRATADAEDIKSSVKRF
jgi:transposase InsO family protein